MRYINFTVEVPVAETAEEMTDMLRNPKLLRKVQAMQVKTVAKEIVAEHIQEALSAPAPRLKY